MNLFAIQNKAYYNHCPVRVRQGENRAKKSGYRPKFKRAPHDDPSVKKAS